MKYSRSLMVIGVAALLAAPALAVDTPQQPAPQPAQPTVQQPAVTPINAARNLPDGAEVTITGTVEEFDSHHPVTLHDSTGSIDVDLSDVRPIALHKGQTVTITGDVSKGPLGGLLGTNIAATDVHL